MNIKTKNRAYDLLDEFGFDGIAKDTRVALMALRMASLEDEIDRLTAAMERVRELHVSQIRYFMDECDDCHDSYPCSTIRALDGDA